MTKVTLTKQQVIDALEAYYPYHMGIDNINFYELEHGGKAIITMKD